MNKLAPIALLLLLSFGGALWYLADHSLNDDVKGSLIKIGNYYTDFVINVDEVAIELNKGYGVISGLSVTNAIPSTNTVANTATRKTTPFVTIDKITLTFDPQDLSTKNANQEVIILKKITLTGAKFIKNLSGDKDTNLQHLLNNINDKISALQPARKLKSEPYFQVNDITMSNVELLIPSKDNDTITHTFNELHLAGIGMKDGLPVSLFGVEVLRKTIEKILAELITQ